MAERADIYLRPNPSTDTVWLSAIAGTFWIGLAQGGFYRRWVNI